MLEQAERSNSLGVLACDDFFFETRICDTAKELGRNVRSFTEIERIAEVLSTETVTLLLIDLSSMSGCLDELPRFRKRAPKLKVIAFGSHVQVDLLKRAREAGCDAVMPRSRFTGELVKILQEEIPAESS